MIVRYNGSYDFIKGKDIPMSFTLYKLDDTDPQDIKEIGFTPESATYTFSRGGVQVITGNMSIEENVVTSVIPASSNNSYGKNCFIKIVLTDDAGIEYDHSIAIYIVRSLIQCPITSRDITEEWPCLISGGRSVDTWANMVNIGYKNAMNDLRKKIGFESGVVDSGNLVRLFTLSAGALCLATFPGEENQSIAENARREYKRELDSISFFIEDSQSGVIKKFRGYTGYR